MAAAIDLAGMVPGFDFLQGLMKNSGAALPAMGQWVAPTLDPQELEKRISELRTVQFWLEQNAKLLATTIQALEVQRMTLATLQTMNLPMADLRDSLRIKVPAASPPPPAAPPAVSAAPPVAAPAKEASPQAAAKPPVDPLLWWGALTQQFTDLAAQAMKDSAAAAAAAPAPSAVAAGAAAPKAVRKARAAPAKAARKRAR